jgi:exopolyphosphatase/guanosine-5'-triphosphate,3'-diphosphate pyrophosphatase
MPAWPTCSPVDDRRLVIDIGGRSTEMILGRGRQPDVAESFKVGSVSLSMRWFADGRYTQQAFRDAQVAAGAELEEALTAFPPARWQRSAGIVGHGWRGFADPASQRPHDGASRPKACAGASTSAWLPAKPDRLALPG